MVLDRTARNPSPATAVAVRLAAFLTAVVTVILVPLVLAAAARGHGSSERALFITAVAGAITLATTLAARSLDPLRRQQNGSSSGSHPSAAQSGASSHPTR